MTENEKNIMTDAYHFLQEFGCPPHIRATTSEAFWQKAGDRLVEIGQKYRNHPLAMLMMPAIYDYIEAKQKGISK